MLEHVAIHRIGLLKETEAPVFAHRDAPLLSLREGATLERPPHDLASRLDHPEEQEERDCGKQDLAAGRHLSGLAPDHDEQPAFGVVDRLAKLAEETVGPRAARLLLEERSAVIQLEAVTDDR